MCYVRKPGNTKPDLLTPREHIELLASYYPDPLGLDAVIDMCKLAGFADKKYNKLSGGQKRRVQLALAIIGNPELVFLDEPTTGLDTDTRRMFWDVVRRPGNEGRTIILTTHYLEEADALADRIVVMNAGKIIADAPLPRTSGPWLAVFLAPDHIWRLRNCGA